MAFKFRWLVTLERTDDGREHSEAHFLIRWAVVGMAVLGLVAVAIWRLV